MLLLAFAMLSQRRILSLIHLFTLQGAALVAARRRSWPTSRTSRTSMSAAPHVRAQGVLIPLLLHRIIQRLDVRWDVETLINMPTTMLIGIVLVIFCVQPRVADLAALVVGRPRHARHRAGVRAAVVPDDDHPRQGGAAGDRLPVDGERPVLRRHLGDLRHADGGRARHRARRAGRHADPRRVHVPDPRAVRQPRHPPPREAEGRAERGSCCSFVLGIPLCAAAVARPSSGTATGARDVNVASASRPSSPPRCSPSRHRGRAAPRPATRVLRRPAERLPGHADGLRRASRRRSSRARTCAIERTTAR